MCFSIRPLYTYVKLYNKIKVKGKCLWKGGKSGDTAASKDIYYCLQNRLHDAGGERIIHDPAVGQSGSE